MNKINGREGVINQGLEGKNGDYMVEIDAIKKEIDRMGERLDKNEQRMQETNLKLERNNILVEQNIEVMRDVKETIKESSVAIQEMGYAIKTLMKDQEEIKDCLKTVQRDTDKKFDEVDERLDVQEKRGTANWINAIDNGILGVIGKILPYAIVGYLVLNPILSKVVF